MTAIELPAAPRATRWESAIVLLACFGLFTAMSTVNVLRGETGLEFSNASTAATLAFELIAGVSVLTYLRKRGRSLRPFRLRPTWDALLVGSLLGAALFAAGGVVYAIVLLAMPGAEALTPRFADLTNVWLMLAFIVVNSWFEESFVVAYVTLAFEEAGAARVILISTAVRAIYHLYQGPAGAASVAAIGVLLAATYWRTRDLTIPVVAHTVTNVLIIGSA